jgi:tRNA-specific 2-thiouridylase
MKKRVVVAMSGGVDSSVAASLLVEEGYEVIGITMQIWPESTAQASQNKVRGCCGADAAFDAFSVAEQLGIPHYVLNFQEVFQKEVVENFAQEYFSGKTPNPCIRCNEFIKFKALRAKALALQADYLATGHYARVLFDSTQNRYVLLRGCDERKDQSYVLYPLKQEDLAMCLFPLGTWTKEKVREYALSRHLATAEKPESFDICFVPDGNYSHFLEKHAGPSPSGKIVNKEGEILGEHKGLIHYTIGQRRGIGISASTPLYVLALKPESNTLVVGKEEDLFSSSLEAEKVNWVSIPEPQKPIEGMVKIRAHAPLAQAMICPCEGQRAVVRFLEPQKAISPGQSAVFYDEHDRVLGGGIIVRAGAP